MHKVNIPTSVVDSVNGAIIGERNWHFPVDSSIVYKGNYLRNGFEIGCKSFIDQNNEPINPAFNFQNLGGNTVHMIREDTSMLLIFSGDINFRISNVGEVDITGVNCNSGF